MIVVIHFDKFIYNPNLTPMPGCITNICAML